MIDIEVNVTGNKEFQPAVAVVVCPCRPSAEAAGSDASAVSNVFELAVAEIVVKGVASIPGYINVWQAIVVVVGDRNSHAPAFTSQSSGRSDVTKFEPSILMVKSDHGIAALTEVLNRRTIDGNDIEPSVAIAINQP
jgi:hypothetical protein